MIAKIEKIIKWFFWVPFVLAFIGYFWADGGAGCEKLPVVEALYASAALYFVNPVADNANAWILTAEVLAIIVTTSVIISVVSALFGNLAHWWARRWKDSTTVYSDTPWGEQLAETLKHGYLKSDPDLEDAEKTHDHIIMFSDDQKNLNFYEYNKEKMKDSRVFLALNQIDSFLLNSSSDKNVHFFQVYDLIARKYWKENHLYEEIFHHKDGIGTGEKQIYKIAIIGYGNMGRAIFKYGFLNNIYDLNQKIEYHVWGADVVETDFLETLLFENEDIVVVHKEDYKESMHCFAEMNRIIIADGLKEETTLSVLQNLLHENAQLSIHCYNAGEDFTGFFQAPNLYTFGDATEILTEDNIKNERLYRQAKLVNYDYCLRYANASLPSDYEEKIEEEWNKLDGFKKGSNIARADFYWIERKRLDEGAEEETIWRMEHIRWCRYHYYNRWSYAKERDNANRKHHLLVPFDELPQSEKEKDGIYDDTLRKEIEELITWQK
ncbi:RyR domain-containing protein [Thermoguttaceae bacterium LCP21S3_D4]|nr:RyR domain-containing protein [Lachnospiraceae bacterium]MDD6303672.1 RyR domain-containing protein [Lachnospiraceae bacterium]